MFEFLFGNEPDINQHLFKKELIDALKHYKYDIKKYKKLPKEDKKELMSKFADIGLVHSTCGMLVDEEKFYGYVSHSKYNELLK